LPWAKGIFSECGWNFNQHRIHTTFIKICCDLGQRLFDTLVAKVAKVAKLLETTVFLLD
jgi:hypothetical protein